MKSARDFAVFSSGLALLPHAFDYYFMSVFLKTRLGTRFINPALVLMRHRLVLSAASWRGRFVLWSFRDFTCQRIEHSEAFCIALHLGFRFLDSLSLPLWCSAPGSPASSS